MCNRYADAGSIEKKTLMCPTVCYHSRPKGKRGREVMGHTGRESYKQASVTIVTALKGKPRLSSMLYCILPTAFATFRWPHLTRIQRSKEHVDSSEQSSFPG